MNDKINDSEVPDRPAQVDRQDPAQDAPRPDGSGRRRFLGVGAGAAPALLTLASQPALGVTCFTPSRSLSKNTSVSQQGKDGECSGSASPNEYQANQSKPFWPVGPEEKFHPLFRGRRFKKQDRTSMSLGEVLNLMGGAPDSGGAAFYLVAAYLNARGGGGASIPAHVMTPAGVVAIYDEWDRTGYYVPTASVTWSAADIIAYLKNNGIVK